MYNVHTRHITHPNVVIGMALFTGGLAQLLAGMWEFPKGNTFGAASECSISPRSIRCRMLTLHYSVHTLRRLLAVTLGASHPSKRCYQHVQPYQRAAERRWNIPDDMVPHLCLVPVSQIFLCSLRLSSARSLTGLLYNSIGSLRKSISLIAFFSFLSLTFLLLGISQFKGNSSS